MPTQTTSDPYSLTIRPSHPSGHPYFFQTAGMESFSKDLKKSINLNISSEVETLQPFVLLRNVVRAGSRGEIVWSRIERREKAVRTKWQAKPRNKEEGYAFVAIILRSVIHTRDARSDISFPPPEPKAFKSSRKFRSAGTIEAKTDPKNKPPLLLFGSLSRGSMSGLVLATRTGRTWARLFSVRAAANLVTGFEDVSEICKISIARVNSKPKRWEISGSFADSAMIRFAYARAAS